LKDFDASTSFIVDDINMDFAITGPVTQPQASPNATMDDLPPMPPAQSTPLDIILGIEALSNKFDALFQTLGEHINTVEARINSMEERWEMKLAAFNKKLWQMDMNNMSNTISLGYMANRINNLGRLGNTTSFSPPAALSLGNPYDDT
jgi:hypothetical protein